MIKWKALEKSVDESSKMTQKPRIRFLNQLDFCDFSFDLKDKIYIWCRLPTISTTQMMTQMCMRLLTEFKTKT